MAPSIEVLLQIDYYRHRGRYLVHITTLPFYVIPEFLNQSVRNYALRHIIDHLCVTSKIPKLYLSWPMTCDPIDKAIWSELCISRSVSYLRFRTFLYRDTHVNRHWQWVIWLILGLWPFTRSTVVKSCDVMRSVTFSDVTTFPVSERSRVFWCADSGFLIPQMWV